MKWSSAKGGDTEGEIGYGQALFKVQRGHNRDLLDVRSILRATLIARDRLREMFPLSKNSPCQA
jgi:hypothetical protein